MLYHAVFSILTKIGSINYAEDSARLTNRMKRHCMEESRKDTAVMLVKLQNDKSLDWLFAEKYQIIVPDRTDRSTCYRLGTIANCYRVYSALKTAFHINSL